MGLLFKEPIICLVNDTGHVLLVYKDTYSNIVIFSSFSHSSIHQEAPEFSEMSVEQEILETGIKVVDLLAPYAKGGKIGECQNYVK